MIISILRKNLLSALILSITFPLWAGDEQLQQALTAANSGRSQEAINILEQLQSSSPSDERVLRRLGLLYQSTGRYDDAISTLEKAIAIQSSPEALYALGLLYES